MNGERRQTRKSVSASSSDFESGSKSGLEPGRRRSSRRRFQRWERHVTRIAGACVRLGEKWEGVGQWFVVATGGQVTEGGIGTDKIRTLQHRVEEAIISIQGAGTGRTAARKLKSCQP